jgi:hypothetical protein
MTDPNIEHAAAHVAQAEEQLRSAHQRHQEAMAEVATLEGRLQAVAERREKIRTDLASGALSDREAGGLTALADEDAHDLQQLLAEAKARAAAAVPDAEQRAVGLAQESLNRIEREVEFSSLHGRVMQIETAFLQALGALHEKGLALGRGRALSGVYQPSDEMRRALFHGVPPAPPVAVEAGGDGDE